MQELAHFYVPQLFLAAILVGLMLVAAVAGRNPVYYAGAAAMFAFGTWAALFVSLPNLASSLDYPAYWISHLVRGSSSFMAVTAALFGALAIRFEQFRGA
jgi:vacuolar-type H+-ATPase subunit I/STV1